MTSLKSILFIALTTLMGWAIAFPSSCRAGNKWITYENCKLDDDESYSDGDSFYVKTKSYTYIFRLYFVDAAETDTRYPDRVQEQADYFEISSSEAIRLGEEATKFTQKYLKNGFTVYTKKQDARGNSKKNRYYAMLEVDGKFLSEALAEEGLVRIYGVRTELPNGRAEKHFIRDLQKAEEMAKAQAKGGWKDLVKTATGPATLLQVKPVEPGPLSIPRSILIYSTKPPHMARGRLQPNKEVQVVQAEPGGWIRVRVKVSDVKTIEGFCYRTELGL